MTEQLHPGLGSGALREALAELFELVESGELVRDISRDGNADWMPRMLNLTRVLKKAQDALALSLSSPIEPPPTQCDKQTHMYVWTVSPRWVAVAQAQNVADAREVLLEEIGTSRDGSCPEREAADKWVREHNPSIWHARNAEFALTDSAELREQEAYVETLQKKIKALAQPTPQASSEIRERQCDLVELRRIIGGMMHTTGGTFKHWQIHDRWSYDERCLKCRLERASSAGSAPSRQGAGGK